ncbi:RagB/SusD family nutrient uptake outer membrane protein [Pedobacter psychrodurus]|uniref:RagB/SusD family nutrient uptake outer membrane protein n=1 Tax=Pedobacter psychrodurus TaxID=2530456 RepID=A0A4R0PZK0_9SPHI|nr:RagB/SusD family nutrient uptake outer membrane protein [Pedobacter psychrodurus]TCD28690.1 RagB/SusD family nutrient uptake outer membrane protein [Pedobacter psychrodurus]
MKNQSKFNNILLTLYLCISIFGCKKFVEIDLPIDSITTASAFETDAKTNSVIRGLYLNMVKTTGYAFGGSMSIGLGVSADELQITTPTNVYQEFYTNSVSSANLNVASYYWGPLYNTIYTANAAIENIPGSLGMSDYGKKQYMAEARFIRAANYFYLVNIFGDVPLVTGTDYRTNAVLPRSSIERVYELIISDLTFAKENLSTNYLGTTRLRANTYAAAALLARVYLYRSEWAKAEALASEVIAGKNTTGVPLYALEPILNNVFLLSSKEVLLQLQQPALNLYTWDGFNFIQSTLPNYQLTDALFNSFGIGDGRKNSWIKTYTSTTGGVTKSYYSPFKYKISSGTGTAKTESLVFLRLGEVYLIRAESRAQQNNLSDAISDLDVIRKRAGLLAPTAAGATQPELIEMIARERYIELFAELGHRWLDLKRSRRADVVLSGKPNWRPEAKLFPIPTTEIENNPFLIQNPGYN